MENKDQTTQKNDVTPPPTKKDSPGFQCRVYIPMCIGNSTKIFVVDFEEDPF